MAIGDNINSNPYKAYLLSEQKAPFEGRAFGDSENFIWKIIVCLLTSSQLPMSYNEILGLGECWIAPGSIAIYPPTQAVFMMDAMGVWQLWSGDHPLSSPSASDLSGN